ncbi:hypothetical protein E4U43_003777 [Claviceps pusilla]|uniref:Uncharacterized protein n=1 Tax=Claviceps pusilla TaxID=123648 RepID=A0A9P7NJB0_9HYPO|nr:hypothetical protein E4U43_003777 [Claviceps pusilla]
MQLSPLQSRLVASLAATLCLLLLYFLLLAPKGAFAYEAALDSFSWSSSWPDLTSSEDSTKDFGGDHTEADGIESRSLSIYEPLLNFLGRSILGRAGDAVALENDRPLAFDIQPGGALICYVIRKGSLDRGTPSPGKQARDNKGDDEDDKMLSGNEGKNTTIYISANTCLQPTVRSDSNKNSNSDNNGESRLIPPQLVLFLSNGTDTGCPEITNSTTESVTKGFKAHYFEQGAVTANMANVTSDVYIGIYAPKIEHSFDGLFNYEIAVSSAEYFHQYQTDEADGGELLWMDSDSTAALLVTRNLTDEASETRHVWSEDPPYQLYVIGQDTPALEGLRHSACGLRKNARIGTDKQDNAMNNAMVRTSMTLRGPGGLPKQQFYVVGLNATTSYTGILVRPANVTAHSRRSSKRQDNGDGRNPARKPGSVVFQSTNFQTNAAPNCKVVTDLEFCDEIQYAVPGNDGKFNNTELARTYDMQAKSMYDNFLKIMQQIPCEADKTSRYSLARTCEDCKRAYKRWLCTVSLPRCEDFHAGSLFSIIRNVNQPFPNGTMLPADVRQTLAKVPAQNASRNSFIDQTIQPGPYNEIMPCEDICYQVVQSCPSAIQFKCPQPGMYGFNVTYGRRNPNTAVVSCNFPGEARTPISGGWAIVPDLGLVAFITFLFSLLMVA